MPLLQLSICCPSSRNQEGIDDKFSEFGKLDVKALACSVKGLRCRKWREFVRDAVMLVELVKLVQRTDSATKKRHAQALWFFLGGENGLSGDNYN